MLAAAVAVEHEANNDVRANRANHADEVAENFLVAPLLERLFDAEGEAEVDGTREVLIGTVKAVRGRQFLGAQHGQRLEQFRPDLVLAAFTVRRRHQRSPEALAVREVREHRVVLIVRVGGGHHEIAHRVELAQGKFKCRRALQLGHGHQLMLRGRMGGGEGDADDDEGERTAAHSGNPWD